MCIWHLKYEREILGKKASITILIFIDKYCFLYYDKRNRNKDYDGDSKNYKTV